MKKRNLIIILLSLFLLQATSNAQSEDSMLMLPDIPAVEEPRLKNREEQAIRAFEANYINLVFGTALTSNSQSLLSEEEREEIGGLVQNDTYDDILKKELSKFIAKQDLLNLRKTLLKKKRQLTTHNQ